MSRRGEVEVEPEQGASPSSLHCPLTNVIAPVSSQVRSIRQYPRECLHVLKQITINVNFHNGADDKPGGLSNR